MSDTPRTDEMLDAWSRYTSLESDVMPMSGPDLCRTLERELNDARATIKDWTEAADAAMQPNEHEQHCTCVGVLQARVRALERENERLLRIATEATSAT